MYQTRPLGVVSSMSGGFFTGTASTCASAGFDGSAGSSPVPPAALADDDFQIELAIHSRFLSDVSREQGALAYALNCRRPT